MSDINAINFGFVSEELLSVTFDNTDTTLFIWVSSMFLLLRKLAKSLLVIILFSFSVDISKATDLTDIDSLFFIASSILSFNVAFSYIPVPNNRLPVPSYILLYFSVSISSALWITLST